MRKIIIIIIVIGVTFELAAKFILHASDSPDIYFDNNLGIMYKPKQNGTYIKSGDIKAQYSINEQGWNAPFNYSSSKQDGVSKIAIIGDSFIEAFQVNYDDSFSNLLKIKLSDKNVEIIPVAHSGANLIQYLYYLKYVKEKYNPDYYIVNIVENDFDESVNGYSRVDNWSLNYKDNRFFEIPPLKTKNMIIKKILRKSTIIRYLTINLDLINNSKIINKLFYLGLKNKNYQKPNIDMDMLISYIFERYKETTNSKILVILNNNDYYENAKKILEEKQIDYVVTKDIITDKYFFSSDPHWNKEGHKIISEIVSEKLVSDFFDTNL